MWQRSSTCGNPSRDILRDEISTSSIKIHQNPSSQQRGWDGGWDGDILSDPFLVQLPPAAAHYWGPEGWQVEKQHPGPRSTDPFLLLGRIRQRPPPGNWGPWGPWHDGTSLDVITSWLKMKLEPCQNCWEHVSMAVINEKIWEQVPCNSLSKDVEGKIAIAINTGYPLWLFKVHCSCLFL